MSIVIGERRRQSVTMREFLAGYADPTAPSLTDAERQAVLDAFARWDVGAYAFMHDGERWLSLEQAGRRIQRSDQTVLRRIRLGRYAATSFGRRWFVRDADVPQPLVEDRS